MPPAASHEKYIEIDDDEEEEIEILPDKSAGSFRCEFCNDLLDDYSPDERQAHYDRHFSNEKPGTRSSVKVATVENKPQSKKKNWTRKPAYFKKEFDRFWYPSNSDEPPPNFTPGLVPILKRALITSHSKGFTLRAALCHEGTVHISREFWDTSWGCGYRNFEIVCTALMEQSIQPVYFALLDFPISPGVRNLQKWIEDAWEKGFDVEGAQQLKKLVGTKQWLGTSDLWVAFSSRGIPAELVDFNSDRGSKVMEKVIDWIVNFFSPQDDRNPSTVDDALRGASPVISTNRMPIILQHKGHSQTIIGYEKTKKGTVNLLTFDPSNSLKPNIRRLSLARQNYTELSSKSQQATPNGLRQFFNTIPDKRRASDSNSVEEKNASKRSRSEVDEDDDDDVVVVGDSKEGEKPRKKGKNKEEDINYSDILNIFRLVPQKLNRKDQYQILYFPLEDPLDKQQRLSRKEVTSTKVS